MQAVLGGGSVFEKMMQERCNALTGGANVAALAAVGAALAGEAVVRREDDGTASEDVRERAGGVGEDGPANGGMADVECEMQGRGGDRGIIRCHFSSLRQKWRRNHDEVRSASRSSPCQSGTPVEKCFLFQSGPGSRAAFPLPGDCTQGGAAGRAENLPRSDSRRFWRARIQP